MARIRSYAKWIFLLVILLVLAQSGLHYALRNHRMRGYLLAHLEKSFGRRVEARDFSMDLLPFPQLEVDRVSIGEDPAFGQEYFLRADRLTAGVRWLGLLRGHFDFGTISLTRPSLILVRNEHGRWNLEGWLPPAPQSSPSGGAVYGPQPPEGANHLQKIEFDEGRINFKTGDEKRPFAFTAVSGSVEQMAPGRWELKLEAQPWRSGVALQSTGTLQVRGEVAGTSSRLQPAQIQVHWDKVSIADLFRMITGNDSGARGEFALDGTANIGRPAPGEAANPGVWKFSIHAWAGKIHRWDLIERVDNPSLSAKLDGVWDVPAGEARAETAVLDLPHSHFAGAALLRTAGMSEWSAQATDAGIDARDALAWYRAFQPDVAESVSIKQFFKASFALHGRPLVLDAAEISSDGGEAQLPGYRKSVRIGKVHGIGGLTGFRHDGVFRLGPVPFFLDGAATEMSAAKLENAKATKERPPLSPNELEFSLIQNFTENGSVGECLVRGRVGEVTNLLQAAAGLGRTINRGWELSGGAEGEFVRDWGGQLAASAWGGSLSLNKAQLQAAGLNLPMKLDEVHANWSPGKRRFTIVRADAFGATWSGSMEESPAGEPSAAPQWKFQLHADHLDAADLDRWLGPRARPGWLQRLLPSLLGKSDSNAKPSELLRRISAEGDLTADSLTVEKVKLARPGAHIRFHDLHLDVENLDAEWAGGTVRGSMNAVFSVPPRYEISAEVEHANLSEFPWGAHWAERWNGAASGKVHLTTSGVGRDALLGQLAGSGQLWLKPVELYGWDVAATLEGTAPHTGSSRWASGEGEFTVKNRALQFEALRLENPREKLSISGEFRFSQEMNLTFAPESSGMRKAKAASNAPHAFLLAGPLEKPVASVQSVTAAQAEKRE